jgi:hypothetical protein
METIMLMYVLKERNEFYINYQFKYVHIKIS